MAGAQLAKGQGICWRGDSRLQAGGSRGRVLEWGRGVGSGLPLDVVVRMLEGLDERGLQYGEGLLRTVLNGAEGAVEGGLCPGTGPPRGMLGEFVAPWPPPGLVHALCLSWDAPSCPGASRHGGTPWHGICDTGPIRVWYLGLTSGW